MKKVKSTRISEIKFPPLTEKDVWAVRLLDPQKIRSVYLIKTQENACDKSIYVDMGDLSDYETVVTPDGDKINAAGILKEKLIGKANRHSTRTAENLADQKTGQKTGQNDTLYAVVSPDQNERPHIWFGISHNGIIYEGGEKLLGAPLAKSIHTRQTELNRSLYDTYDSFANAVLNVVKERNIRTAVEEKFGTHNDEFYDDDFFRSSYVQIRKPKNETVKAENIIIIASDPWNTTVKI